MIIIFYYLITGIILISSFFSESGIILGSDWSFPYTAYQLSKYADIFSNTWLETLLGGRNIIMTSFISIPFVKTLFSLFGFEYVKFIILALFVLAGYSMFSLLKFFELKKWTAFWGGCAYITAPVFFNYTIMGWQFVLLAMGLLPLAVKYFIKAIKENEIKYSIITSLVWSLAMLQSQSIVWFPLVFLCLGFYLIEDKKTFLIYFKHGAFIFLLFILFNFYWLLGMILIKDSGASGSGIINSAVSLGILGHFQPINILRLFGGLYNFQYESVMINSKFSFLSFVFPLLAWGALTLRKNSRLVISFSILALVPMMMYLLNFNRDILLNVPFSNVIRDFARFTVLSSLAYAVLAAFFLNWLGERKKIVFSTIILVWFVSIFPWWTGKISDWKTGLGSDVRLRTKNFPEEYLTLERNFSTKKMDQKVFYIPSGGIVDFEDDEKFHGAYHEAQDIFAYYSPLPGALAVSDRNMGSADDFARFLMKKSDESLNGLDLTNVRYIVVRKNAVFKNKEKIIKNLEKNKELQKYYEGKAVLVFAKKNFIPHFYSAEKIIIENGKSFNFESAGLFDKAAVYFEK